MKKPRKFHHSLLTLLLAAFLLIGSSAMTASAAFDPVCRHTDPKTIRTGERSDPARDRKVLIISDDPGNVTIKSEICYVSNVYRTEVTSCSLCGLVISTRDVGYIGERHSINH